MGTIVATKENLLKALIRAPGIVPKKPSMPILGHFLICKNNNDQYGYVTYTNIENEVQADLACSGDGVGTLPAKEFMKFLRNLKKGTEVSITFGDDCLQSKQHGETDGVATVKVPNGEFLFGSFDPDKVLFPETIDDFDGSFYMNKDELGMLLGVSHAMGTKDVRYYLNGLMIKAAEKEITAVATNGHTLSKRTLPFDTDFPELIIHRDTVLELKALLKNKSAMRNTWLIGVAYKPGQCIRFNIGGYLLTGKLIDGRFPDYTKAIPKVNGSGKFSVSKDNMLGALEHANNAFVGYLNILSLECNGGSLIIKTGSVDQGGAELSVPLNVDSEVSKPVGYNTDYLIDAVGTVEGNNVEFTIINGGHNGFVIEGRNSFEIVMPCRL